MRVVRGEKSTNPSILNIVLSPFMLIIKLLMVVWNILFRFPNEPAHILGFIRLAFWAFIIIYPDFSEVSKYFTNIPQGEPFNTWMVIRLLSIPFSLLMCLYSLGVMLGLHNGLEYKGDYGEYTNIDAMQRLIDGRLSSPGNRGKLLKKLFDDE